jgi:TrmH family RNA methyltransferase
MLSKNELKYIQSLCHKKQRQEEALFIAEGVKLVDELLNSDYRIKKIYATEVWAEQRPGMETTIVTNDELAKISTLQAPNQVLVIAEQTPVTGQPVFEKQVSLVLDGIQDPGNFGTIIRIADWFGISQIVASPETVELYNPKVIQGTMGSFIRVNVWYRPLPELLSAVKLPVYGALLDGTDMYQSKAVSEGILIIGNEARGISPGLIPFITHPITIPRMGGAESLNAAVATGIIVAQFRKPG